VAAVVGGFDDDTDWCQCMAAAADDGVCHIDGCCGEIVVEGQTPVSLEMSHHYRNRARIVQVHTVYYDHENEAYYYYYYGCYWWYHDDCAHLKYCYYY
jgi:hypothetical protein